MRFEWLDITRGFLALSIALFHWYRNPGGAYLAVDYFFVLSGFVLCHTYASQSSSGGSGWKKFTFRRLARLYPLHIFTFIVFLTYKEFQAPLTQVLSNLLLLQNVGFHTVPTLNAPSWSISTEFVIALLAYPLLRDSRKIPLWFYSLIAIVSYGTLAYFFGHIDVHYRNVFKYVNSGLLRCLGGFVLGILTYRLFLKYKPQLEKSKMKFLVLTLLISLVVYRFYFYPFRHSLTDFVAPLVFSSLVVFLATLSFPLNSLTKALRLFGKCAYALYLSHYMLMYYVKRTFSDSVFVYVLCCLVFAWLLYVLIEEPVRNFALKRIA